MVDNRLFPRREWNQQSRYSGDEKQQELCSGSGQVEDGDVLVAVMIMFVGVSEVNMSSVWSAAKSFRAHMHMQADQLQANDAEARDKDDMAGHPMHSAEYTRLGQGG